MQSDSSRAGNVPGRERAAASPERGGPAARSVLLTLLGEYVLPAAGSAWQETLIGALETLDHKTPAARRALARSVTAGWLRTERHGRRSRVHLTPATAEMLRSGTERIYSFGDPWTWDGRWLLVVLRVPEERREVRHQVRVRLAWAGFGSLGGGLWISPSRRARARVCTTWRWPRIGGRVSSLFHAEIGDVRRSAEGSSPRPGISTPWPRAYRTFIARFGRLRPGSPGGDVPCPDAARPRVAQVPLPRSRPARRHAPVRAGPAGARTTVRASATRSGTSAAQEYFGALELLVSARAARNPRAAESAKAAGGAAKRGPVSGGIFRGGSAAALPQREAPPGRGSSHA